MGFLETILCSQGEIPFLEQHLQRLSWGIFQNGFIITEDEILGIRQYILTKIPKDKKTYKLRFLCFAHGKNQFTYQAELIEFRLDTKRVYRLGVYTEDLKQTSSPWNAKTTERKLYEKASVWAKAHHFDEAVILNADGNIVETCIFNTYILKDEILYTPPLSDIPVKGVFRTWLSENSIFTIIEKSLTVEDLKTADVIILTNALRGICIGSLLSG